MTSADAITIRVLAPSEAALLTGLIGRCYGASHVDPSFYDVDALRELGFFFSGLLPEYQDGDILRMQRLDDSVDVAPAGLIELDSTRAIEAFVLEDPP